MLRKRPTSKPGRRSRRRARRLPPPNAASQRLETEAKTISKLLAVESKNLWPPVMDALTVAEGYEKALGAALGDDLDAPTGKSAPMRWAGATPDPSDPALPEGVTALSEYVKAPPELARRLAQIGVVARAEGARLAAIRDCSSPANGWFPPRAISGAGTVLRSRPMHRPAQRGGLPNAGVCRRSKANSPRRGARLK